MSGRLANKTALILGIGSVGPGWGNGRASAVLFAREGANVFGMDIDLEAAQATAALIGEEGYHEQVTVIQSDITDEAAIAEAVAHCLEVNGRIDILLNNVGAKTMLS